eukprot:TRINITY_DN2162_c0_g1_i4.p1 TRINITY_DN2162_c0_g1~~TRINITY_DN2162_c0_g1_i4.p1  ORF type:complete len:265 (+),score=55.60 TRINITY_DN2162_c0_g1_i4:452-1246(+)
MKDGSDLRSCAEYAADALAYLRAREQLVHFQEHFLQAQPQITSAQRERSIEWLVEVQTHFKLSEDTLFMAAGILDRVLSRVAIDRDALSLLALTALNIAAKYEEIYPPHLKDFIVMADDKYSAKEVHDMELKVLEALDFELSVPSALAFIGRFRELMRLKASPSLALYICEAQLLTPGMCKYAPSLLAISAIHLAEKAVNREFNTSELPLKEANYSEEDVMQCSKDMLNNMLVKEQILLSNIRRKYKDVGKIVFKEDLLNDKQQ